MKLNANKFLTFKFVESVKMSAQRKSVKTCDSSFSDNISLMTNINWIILVL